jgi:hypothetical protein
MMQKKYRITYDSATLGRSAVEYPLIREKVGDYELLGTFSSTGEDEMKTGSRSPRHLVLPQRVTDAERAFLAKFAFHPDHEPTMRYLCVHSHEARDVFVTENEACFGEAGSERRRQMSMLVGTVILSLKEFRRWCSGRQPRG